MADELKEIYLELGKYLKKNAKKIIAWVVFIFGIYSIIRGFFPPIGFFLGILLVIVSGIILTKELKILGSFLGPRTYRISSAGPVLVVVGIIFIIIGIPFFVFTTAFLGWGIGFLIIGIPLATTNLILKHHIIGDWGHLYRRSSGKGRGNLYGHRELSKTVRCLINQDGKKRTYTGNY